MDRVSKELAEQLETSQASCIWMILDAYGEVEARHRNEQTQLREEIAKKGESKRCYKYIIYITVLYNIT